MTPTAHRYVLPAIAIVVALFAALLLASQHIPNRLGLCPEGTYAAGMATDRSGSTVVDCRPVATAEA